MKMIFILSIILSANSFAARGVLTAENAKKVNIKALGGTYTHKLGFGVEVEVYEVDNSSNQGDLFTPSPEVTYEVEVSLNNKAESMQYGEVFLEEGRPNVSVDNDGEVTLSINRSDCDDPECTNINTVYHLVPNKKKTKYYLTASSEIDNDARQGIEENEMQDNPHEYCEMFFEEALFIEDISEYDGRTCMANATYYMSKK